MSSDPFNFDPPTGSAPPPQGPFSGPPVSQPVPASPHGPVASSGGASSPFGVSGSNPLAAPTSDSAGPGGNDVFGSGDPAAAVRTPLTVAKPPAYLLLVALGVAIAAGVVALLLLDNIVVAVICWLAAGPIAIGLVALFVVRDTWARSSGAYSSPDWIRPLHYGTTGLCLLAILAPALRIANWVGHL